MVTKVADAAALSVWTCAGQPFCADGSPFQTLPNGKYPCHRPTHPYNQRLCYPWRGCCSYGECAETLPHGTPCLTELAVIAHLYAETGSRRTWDRASSTGCSRGGPSTTQESSQNAGTSFTLAETDITLASLTCGGNGITGEYTQTEYDSDSSSLSQQGQNAAGSFTVSQTTSDSRTLRTTGNSVSGDYTLSQSGSEGYSFDEQNSGNENFTLAETGLNAYNLTVAYSATTGQTSQLQTGSDGYTITESGSNGAGLASFTQTLTGTDNYTQTETDNAADGGFSRTLSGSGSYTLVTSGTDSQGNAVNTTASGSDSPALVETGNYVEGQLSISGSSGDRYSHLALWNNTSGAAAGAAGTLDYSPVGAPLVLGQGTGAGAGAAAQPCAALAPAAVDAMYAQLGDDLAHQYCFAAGTPVVLADGSSKPIEEIQPGQWVLAASADDPEGPVAARQVLQVYHNAPARLLNLHVGERVIRVTLNHTLFVRGRGFTAAKDLRPGDEFRTHDGRWLSLTKVFDNGDVEPVYNLQVADAHTYFIGSPEWGLSVLVHNDSPDDQDQDMDSEDQESGNNDPWGGYVPPPGNPDYDAYQQWKAGQGGGSTDGASPGGETPAPSAPTAGATTASALRPGSLPGTFDQDVTGPDGLTYTYSYDTTTGVPTSNPQTGIYQLGGGHQGSLNIMSDSFLDRGNFNTSSASTAVTAARAAADQVDRAIDLLENHYPEVQAAAAPLNGFNNSDQLLSEDGRQQMLGQLRTVQAALNSSGTYTNIVLDASDSGEGRLGYTPFLAYTNVVTGFVHLTPLYFANNPNTDPVQQAAAQATTMLHELGRYYNSLGESLTGTKYDVYSWDNKIQFLNAHYTQITGKK